MFALTTLFIIAQAAPTVDGTLDVVGMLPKLVAALSSGNYKLVLAIVLMLAVYAVRRFFWSKIETHKAWLSHVTALLAGLSALAAALYTGQDIGPAVAAAIETALGATAAWELLKPLLRKFGILPKTGGA